MVPLHAKEIMDPQQELAGYHIPGSKNPDNPMQMRTPEQVR